jgi:hypothetical protein
LNQISKLIPVVPEKLAFKAFIVLVFSDAKFATFVDAVGDTWFDYPYPPTVNDAALTAFAKRVAAPIVGEAALHFDEKPVMGGEVRAPPLFSLAPLRRVSRRLRGCSALTRVGFAPGWLATCGNETNDSGGGLVEKRGG